MVNVAVFHIALYLAGLCVSTTCLVNTLIVGHTYKPQNKIYLAMQIIVILNILSEFLVSWTYLRPETSTMILWRHFGDYTYLLLHASLCPLFQIYVSHVTGIWPRLRREYRILALAPFLFMEILILLNPLLHQVYTYGADGTFQRGWGEYMIYIIAVASMALALITLLRSWNGLNFRRKASIFYFLVVAGVGMLVQLLWYDIRSELFAEALALMGLMLSIEQEYDTMDMDTGFRNRKGLALDMQQHLENHMEFSVICIKITNAGLIQKVTGSSNQDILASILFEYFCSIAPRYNIYQVAKDTFVFLITEPREKASELASRIHNRFEQPWLCRKAAIFLNTQVLVGAVPDDLHTVREMFYMADCEVPSEFRTRSILSGRDLDYLFQRREIEESISRGLREHSFVVYYQPTYCIDGKNIHGAEALCRLKDEKYGLLMPDDFIPIAEQMGVIDEIDDFVLREVCQFIADGMPSAIGLESINVNLSVVQCMQPAFASHIISILEEYRINQSMITFEITESIASDDYEKLSSVIKRLKDYGFRFAMDDFGTGYSNMNAIFSLDFDTIKIDKSILWGAQKTALGASILRNCVRMIKEMGRKVLVEGVETEDQIRLLGELGVDYLQGFYFSKPVPKEELLKKI